jgi:hypothetical protein
MVFSSVTWLALTGLTHSGALVFLARVGPMEPRQLTVVVKVDQGRTIVHQNITRTQTQSGGPGLPPMSGEARKHSQGLVSLCE